MRELNPAPTNSANEEAEFNDIVSFKIIAEAAGGLVAFLILCCAKNDSTWDGALEEACLFDFRISQPCFPNRQAVK